MNKNHHDRGSKRHVRLETLVPEKSADAKTVAWVREFALSIAHRYDRRPVIKAEWDTACGDNPDDLGF